MENVELIDAGRFCRNRYIERTIVLKFWRTKMGLFVYEKDESFISIEDYAMAMVDELEQGNHHRERFTIGY